jgi:glycosyltransferase involved in cell wall biosynthesis
VTIRTRLQPSRRRGDRIRVLHVLQTIGIGGTERRVLRLRQGLDNSIYDVRAVSLRPTPETPLPWPESGHVLYPIAPGLHLGRLQGLASLMRKERYDIVHSHNWATMLYGVLAARLGRVPIVLHGEHGPNSDDWKGVSRKREAAAVILAHLATRVVTVNESIQRDVETRWKLSPSHVICIPNGVDLTRFTPKIRADRPHTGMVIGTVARFDSIKNLPCIIRGFDLFKRSNPRLEARLVLVGTGPLWQEIRALAANMDSAPYIDLPGDTSHPEDWYSRFDVYVNSSFSEGMNNTILEAMASALPVVASSIPGNRSWLEDSVNALFFESDNAEDLCQRFAIIAHDAPLRRRIGDENRRRAERQYSNRDFITRYAQLYQHLLRR